MGAPPKKVLLKKEIHTMDAANDALTTDIFKLAQK